MKDPGTTGNFEVTVNGKLVFSKKTRGEGFLEEAKAEKQEEVKVAIQKEVKVPPPYISHEESYHQGGQGVLPRYPYSNSLFGKGAGVSAGPTPIDHYNPLFDQGAGAARYNRGPFPPKPNPSSGLRLGNLESAASSGSHLPQSGSMALGADPA